MKKMNKKGFTIVELVIVIAVIAILAAVLIPTFSGVIEKAQKNANLQQARNFYTLVEANTVGGVHVEKNDTIVDSYDISMSTDGLVIKRTKTGSGPVDALTVLVKVLGDDAKTYKGATLAVEATNSHAIVLTDNAATLGAFYFQANGNSHWVKIDLANGTLTEEDALPTGAISNSISAN